MLRVGNEGDKSHYGHRGGRGRASREVAAEARREEVGSNDANPRSIGDEQRRAGLGRNVLGPNTPKHGMLRWTHR